MNVQNSIVDHRTFMRSAIALAETNRRAPFGSVIVDRRTSEIVGSGVNRSKTNPTFHGEIVAIHDCVAQNHRDWDFFTLYTTAEPCCMCQGAILWSGIREVVFGTSIQQLIRFGWKQIDISASEVARQSWAPDLVITPGVLAEQCDRLFEVSAPE